MFRESANKAFVDRKISNEMENRIEIQEIYDKKRYLEPLITEKLAKMQSHLGSTLEGLEHSVKTASSFEGKVGRLQAKAQKTGRKLSAVEAANEVTDVVRYTEVCAHNKIFDTAKATIQMLENAGYLLREVKNYYANPFSTTGYRGLHLNFISPQGVPFELQVHSTESLSAKETGHKLYEKMRALSTPIEEKERLEPLIRNVHGRFPDPPGIDSIKEMKLSKAEVEAFLSQIPEISVNFAESDGVKQYEVTQNGKNLCSGVELSFDDKSVLAVRAFSGEKNAEVLSFDETGGVITTHKEVNKELLNGIKNLEDARDMKDMMHCASVLWMKGYQEQTLDFTKYITAHMDTPEKIMKGVAEKDRYLYGLVNGSDLETIKKDLLKGFKSTYKDTDKRKTKIVRSDDEPER